MKLSIAFLVATVTLTSASEIPSSAGLRGSLKGTVEGVNFLHDLWGKMENLWNEEGGDEDSVGSSCIPPGGSCDTASWDTCCSGACRAPGGVGQGKEGLRRRRKIWEVYGRNFKMSLTLALSVVVRRILRLKRY